MQVEAELQELEKEEADEYLASLGVEEGGLRSLVQATYRQLGLLTYFTTGKSSLAHSPLHNDFDLNLLLTHSCIP